MNIIHIAAEFAPLAKAGGLGDVTVGLCRELNRLNVQSSIILPKYDFIDPDLIRTAQPELINFEVFENGQSIKNTMWKLHIENCNVLLLETFHPKKYFNRNTIYGCPDDTARFLYFCKAALEFIHLKKIPISLLQMHDWHTAAAAILAKDIYKSSFKTLFTIHNAEHQGLCASWDLDAIGLEGKKYHTPDVMQDDVYTDAINLMKGAVLYADAVNTVSPTYSQEILQTSMTGAIANTFAKHKNKLHGILNGIDYTIWNPETDPHLSTNYTGFFDLETIEIAKNAAKNLIRSKCQLALEKRPWVGSITRIVPQKSPELIEEGIQSTINNGGCFILLGSSPIESLQEHFNKLKKKYENNNQVLLHFSYNEALAHQIYAALDFLLMPSSFEPCGLSQLIAMRYGTIPITRKTGGLSDTVFDFENSSLPEYKRNGFVFEEKSTKQTNLTIQRALKFFHQDIKKFTKKSKHVMNQDYSWEIPAQNYIKLYQKLIEKS